MEKSLFKIIKYILQISLALGILYGLVFFAVYIIDQKSSSPIAEKRGQQKGYVLSEVTDAFSHFELEPPAEKESTLELEERELITLEILKTLQKKDIEAYRLVEGDHISLHIYDQKEKIFFIQFIPKKSTKPQALSLPNKIKQADSIAIVLAGIGNKDIRNLTSIKQPLNFAISPYQPFSLRIAQQAAHHWHEILIDHRNLEQETWNSLPFYSGVLVEKSASPPSAYIDVLSLKSSKLVKFPEINQLNMISLNQTWDEALLLAKEHNSAIILIDIANKNTNELELWLENLPENISLSLLSEV